MASTRLDKYIADITELSRKQVRQAIRGQRIRVDGAVVTMHQLQVDCDSVVKLDGTTLRPPGLRYFMLYKPSGVICANRDSHHITAIDLLQAEHCDSLQIAGRLDIDTTGLVLLTDDGQWNHRLTSPRYHCVKEYLVATAETISNDAIDHFSKGVLLQPENRLTRPARLELLDPSHARLFLSEGRYHQVKRMFAALGNAVVGLHRSAVGDIRLDDKLQPGEYRALEAAEIAAI
jgi:16S rRNA pseudouridine516 synthase